MSICCGWPQDWDDWTTSLGTSEEFWSRVSQIWGIARNLSSSRPKNSRVFGWCRRAILPPPRSISSCRSWTIWGGCWYGTQERLGTFCGTATVGRADQGLSMLGKDLRSFKGLYCWEIHNILKPRQRSYIHSMPKLSQIPQGRPIDLLQEKFETSHSFCWLAWPEMMDGGQPGSVASPDTFFRQPGWLFCKGSHLRVSWWGPGIRCCRYCSFSFDIMLLLYVGKGSTNI